MLRRVVLVLVGGLALWASFPSLNWWWAAPIGIALLTLGTLGVRAGEGALLGLLAGIAFFYPLINWVGVYLGPLPIVALVGLEALYVAAAGAGMAVVQRTVVALPGGGTQIVPRVAPLAVAAVWTAAEWIRGAFPFGGFAWGKLAFASADAPWLPGIAYLGTTGMGFLIALMGACVAAVIHRLVTRSATPVAPTASTRPSDAGIAARGRGATAAGPGRRGRYDVLAPALVAVALAVGASLVPRTIGPDEGSVSVMAVQGNVPRAGLDFNAQRRAVTDNHARATIYGAEQVEAGVYAQPDLVVWPENSSDIDPTRHADAQRVITGAVEAIGAPTLVGAVLTEPADMLSNTALLYLPGEGIVDRYVKQHPVPFAEYMPYRGFFRSITSMVDLLARDYVPGQRDVVFTVPRAEGAPIRLAAPICFEVSIDQVMGDHVRKGANLLAVPTNNATFGFTDESVQQLGISRVRAVEFGRSIVHVSTVGVSALITPDGAAHQKTDLFTQDVLSGSLPLRSAFTPATHLGAWPGIAATLAAAAAVLVRATQSRRARRA